MRLIYCVLALAAMVPVVCKAGCWEVSDLKGVSAAAHEAYKLTPDGFGKNAPAIHLVSTDAGGMVSGHGDFVCKEFGPTTVVCFGGEAGSSHVETWTIDPVSDVAWFTRTRSGFGPFDGAALFVGKAVSCKKSRR